jgi:hypothetical protein
MLKLQVIRPNTIGVTFEREYDSYSDAEELIERKCEQLADQGWQLTEERGSNSNAGSIECVHDNVADSILIHWYSK